MTEQYVPNLGDLPDENARRDAVHIAVIPVTATHALLPGEHVGVKEDGLGGWRAQRNNDRPVGVVDPFLQDEVPAGKRCWLFLYPGTVTSLRHVWTHPAFSVQAPGK